MKRAALSVLALGFGSMVATQVFAYQAGYHPSLGRHLYTYGVHRLYAPHMAWKWGHQWARDYPGRFRMAGMAGLLTTMTLMIPVARKKEGKNPGARWATKKDLDKAGLFAPSGIVLGLFDGKVIRHNGPEHVLVVAPTQSGKTTSLVIPTLLNWAGSVIIHDPKEELYDLTAGFRQTISRVVHFNPTAAGTHHYNPLDAVRLGTVHEIRDAQLIADILVDPEGMAEYDGTAKHFNQLAASLLTGLIIYGLESGEGRELAALNGLLTSQEFDALVDVMAASQNPTVQRAGMVTSQLQNNEKSGVLSTASRALRLWTDPLIEQATASSDFTLEDLREQPLPMSLYLSVPFGDQERLRPLTRLIVRQVLAYCTSRKEGWQHRMLGLIDELPALRRMAILSDGLDYTAGFGVQFVLITPSLNKVEQLYGTHHNLIEGCKYRVVFAPNDDDVATKFSRMTGMTMVEKQRETIAREPWQTMRDRTSVSTETIQEPLLSSTALMQLPADAVVLLVGNSPPAQLKKARYYENKAWKAATALPPDGSLGKDRVCLWQISHPSSQQRRGVSSRTWRIKA